MKSFVNLTLAVLACSLAISQGKSVQSPAQNSIHSSMKKPFISPDDGSYSKDFKRIKRSIGYNPNEFQNFIKASKEQCCAEMGLPTTMADRILMNAENLSKDEKCLLACIFTKTQIMDHTNKLSVPNIGRIAEMISFKNPLVVSIAMVAADRCNRKITANEPCEAAYQISQAISNEMKAHKINIIY